MQQFQQLDSPHSEHTQPNINPPPTNHQQTATPLTFALYIRQRYYISYLTNDLTNTIIRSIIYLALNLVLIFFIHQLQKMGESFKLLATSALIAQYSCYLLICFLDPGTLEEDEEDNFGQERSFCNICQLHKLRTSRHCIWCNRCIQKYDHHCSVFGKCIGKRNLFLFWSFLLLCGLEGPLILILFITF